MVNLKTTSKEASQGESEASLAYLNAIDDATSVLASHIKNQELKEAEEILSILAEQITEFKTFLLEEARDAQEQK